ncbi:ABC transporter ATP-binding protein [Lunatimonas salinarum]|uniref:ABC transporter ATP-binding protein n=1 Tax=Lunatimonas salinarum TaxID=1774590 RepID=UPI001ADF70B9|nr:ABC transporter ATP-binding protein [Lunatimonas salinarum]
MGRVSLRDVFKSYGKKSVLKGVTLDIHQGEIHVLLGINGSGKSTLINIISGLVSADTGSLVHCGKGSQSGEVKDAKIGYVFEQPIYLPYLSAYDNLVFVARMQGLVKADYEPRIVRLMEDFGLPVGSEIVRNLSKGMKSRVYIAMALVGQPNFLILDEPADGLDFVAANQLVRDLLMLKDEGVGIFITSHQFDFIWETATVFSILKNGEIPLTMNKDELVLKAREVFPERSESSSVKSFLEASMLIRDFGIGKV